MEKLAIIYTVIALTGIVQFTESLGVVVEDEGSVLIPIQINPPFVPELDTLLGKYEVAIVAICPDNDLLASSDLKFLQQI